MHTITFLVIYHFSINVKDDLIPIIENVVGLALPSYSEIKDVHGEYYILFWDNLTVPNNFKANIAIREIYQKISKVEIIIVEHHKGFWEKHGALVGIGVGVLSVILGAIALSFVFYPPH